MSIENNSSKYAQLLRHFDFERLFKEGSDNQNSNDENQATVDASTATKGNVFAKGLFSFQAHAIKIAETFISEHGGATPTSAASVRADGPSAPSGGFTVPSPSTPSTSSSFFSEPVGNQPVTQAELDELNQAKATFEKYYNLAYEWSVNKDDFSSDNVVLTHNYRVNPFETGHNDGNNFDSWSYQTHAGDGSSQEVFLSDAQITELQDAIKTLHKYGRDLETGESSAESSSQTLDQVFGDGPDQRQLTLDHLYNAVIATTQLAGNAEYELGLREEKPRNYTGNLDQVSLPISQDNWKALLEAQEVVADFANKARHWATGLQGQDPSANLVNEVVLTGDYRSGDSQDWSYIDYSTDPNGVETQFSQEEIYAFQKAIAVIKFNSLDPETGRPSASAGQDMIEAIFGDGPDQFEVDLDNIVKMQTVIDNMIEASAPFLDIRATLTEEQKNILDTTSELELPGWSPYASVEEKNNAASVTLALLADLIDTNGTGRISRAEIAAMIKELETLEALGFVHYGGPHSEALKYLLEDDNGREQYGKLDALDKRRRFGRGGFGGSRRTDGLVSIAKLREKYTPEIASEPSPAPTPVPGPAPAPTPVSPPPRPRAGR